MRPHAPSSAFADQALRWLGDLDPGVFDASRVPLARDGLFALHASAGELRAWFAAQQFTARADLRVVAAFEAMIEPLPEPRSVGGDPYEWLALRELVAPLYEAYARALLSRGVRALHLHPTNVKRSAVHLASGLLVVAAFQFVFTPVSAKWTALAFVVWAWSLEGARRLSPRVNALCMAFFGPIARDHERYRVNSATWYGTALFVLAFTAFGPAGVLALLALAVGDPVAGLVGRRYGQIRLWGGKSLEGSLAFALSASVAAYLYLLAFQWTLAPVGVLLALALIAGVTGAVVELLSTRLEDNFTIPVFTAWVGQGALALLT